MSDIVLLCAGFLFGWFCRSVMVFMRDFNTDAFGGYQLRSRPSIYPPYPPPRDP